MKPTLRWNIYQDMSLGLEKGSFSSLAFTISELLEIIEQFVRKQHNTRELLEIIVLRLKK